MDNISAIPVFVAVIEHGGFSPAARYLGISKAAVSKRITQLEDQLGVKLLHRTTRKLSLTEAGERFFEHATIANRAAKNATDAVSELQGDPQGLLRIACSMSFGRLHISPLIPEFLKLYPKISIDLVMDDKIVDLIAGGFDLSIRGGELTDSSLVARRLAPLNSVLCASPHYLNEFGTPSALEELTQHNCLSFSYSRDVKEWRFIKEGKTVNIEVSGNFQVNNSEALREAIVQGIGIGRLPTFVAGPDLSNGTLVQLFPEYQMAQLGIFAVFPERQYMPAKVRAFLDFAIDYLGGETPYWEKAIPNN